MWQNNKLETKINCEDDSDNVTLKMIIQYGNCDDDGDDLVAVVTLFIILLFKVIMFMKLTMLIIKAVIMTMMTIITTMLKVMILKTTKDDGDVIMIPLNLMAKVVLMPV